MRAANDNHYDHNNYGRVFILYLPHIKRIPRVPPPTFALFARRVPRALLRLPGTRYTGRGPSSGAGRVGGTTDARTRCNCARTLDGRRAH